MIIAIILRAGHWLEFRLVGFNRCEHVVVDQTIEAATSSMNAVLCRRLLYKFESLLNRLESVRIIGEHKCNDTFED